MSDSRFLDPTQFIVHPNPIQTKLTFAQIQDLARRGGWALSCSLCGHRFPEEGGTFVHECRQPMFKHTVTEVKPLPCPKGIFYLDYQYGRES